MRAWCVAPVPYMIGSGSHPCGRPVIGGGTICEPHRRRARTAFVLRWRAEHADDCYGISWTCDLCGKVLQAGETNGAYTVFLASMADKHKRFHGDDWLAYERAGADGSD